MIEALPFSFELLGSSAQGTGQTGGTAVVQPPSSGNSSENPFAKILRDESVEGSTVRSVPSRIPSANDQNASDRKSSLDHQNLLRLLQSGGKGLHELDGLLPLTLISLLSAGEKDVGQEALPEEPIAPALENVDKGEQLSHGGILPHFIPPGRPEADDGQVRPMVSQTALPFFTEYAPRPESFAGRSSAGANASHIPADGDGPALVQDVVKEIPQLVRASNGISFADPVTGPGKNPTNPVTQVASLVQDADLLVSRMPSPPTGIPQGSPRPVVNQTFQAPLPIEEPSAGIAGVVQLHQHRLNNTNEVSSIVSDVSGQGKEASNTLPSDLLGESGLSVTGDRSKESVEGTGKSLGVDPNGSQGLNNGMGGSPHSQTGFHQHTASPSSGAGVRLTEERIPDFPSPALQRLQMDVQLSDTNRIQIDVGVQHRQVYAGLLMDQATLKNLAIQFIPQLEDQLAQNDMELQEFSAEVRDQHREQESDSNSQGSEAMPGQRGFTNVHSSPELLLNTMKRVEEHGLHLVA